MTITSAREEWTIQGSLHKINRQKNWFVNFTAVGPIKGIVLLLVLTMLSCSSDNDSQSNTLADFAANFELEIDNVIACAASSDTDPNTILAFVYPRPGSTDLRYYETLNPQADKNQYENYTEIDLPSEDIFNGYLKKFTRIITTEKWVIITFIEGGKLHLSNPIKLKHLTQPSVYSDAVSIDENEPLMPIFNWQENSDSAIYFQVISNSSNDLLSGTYTFTDQFQYYNLDNVVLNITRETPPGLEVNNAYNFTLMGVSEDNWVNIFIEKSFIP